MIRINLLPHREEKRKSRQKQFAIVAGLTAAMGIAVAGVLWFIFDRQIDDQKERNKYLTGEITKLEKQIEEIKRIRDETAALLAKKQVVEGLQSYRAEPVYLLDQMLRQLPEGLYLKSIKQTGIKINITGYAQSSARVSALYRNIEASPYLGSPTVNEIKAVTVGNQRANEFNMDFQIKRTKAEDEKGKPRGAPATKPAEKKT